MSTMPRTPAQHGREVARRIALRTLLAFAAFVVATFVVGAISGFGSAPFLVAELLALGAIVSIDRAVTPILDRRIRGNDGERHVGAILDGMAQDGWRVLHDVSLGRGNVDHIAIGPGGVFTIETKSHAGRIAVSKLDPRWLRQAYAERKLIENVTGLKVDALLVFSRAYLDRPVSRQRGVLVLPARMLAGHLARRPPVLEPEQVVELHERLSAALA